MTTGGAACAGTCATGAGRRSACTSTGATGCCTTAAGSAAASVPAMRAISDSNGERGPGCNDTVTSRDNTSKDAANDAAEVCARNIGGSALTGLLLPQAATTSAMSSCNSSDVRWMRSKLSRKARETACSTAFGVLDSDDIPFLRAIAPKISRFVILEGRMRPVNRLTVLLCLEVPLLSPSTRAAPPLTRTNTSFTLWLISLRSPTLGEFAKLSPEMTQHPGPSSIRTLVADDHAVVRQGLKAILNGQEGWSVCAEATCGEEAVALANQLRPDVVVMDLSMPGMSGLDALRAIKSRLPTAGIVILTLHVSDQLVHQIIKLGARAYVMKSDADRELVNAV